MNLLQLHSLSLLDLNLENKNSYIIKKNLEKYKPKVKNVI